MQRAAERRRWCRWRVWTALALVVSAPSTHGSGIRDEEPVAIRGSQMPVLTDTGIDRVHLFRYDATSGSFLPLPYQVDQRVAKTFNAGTPIEFVETIYDVLGEDDGLMDDDDELVFRFADAGELAPSEAPWPVGADGLRYELEIVDPRTSDPAPTRFVYVFLGDDLPHAPTEYVSWNPSASGAATTDTLQIRWDGNWLLTELRVLAPCGTGEDLIDRLKGRALTDQGIEEDEEDWNLNSSYLGGVVGPVRSIRYVQGAASAVNTLHHDIVYRSWWERNVALRVHPLAAVRLYLDLLPITDTRLYAPTLPVDGIAIDGIPDTVPNDPVSWTLFDGPGGGLAIAYDVPPNPLYATKETYYVDDLAHDDRLPFNPGYGDDDDSAYGAHGVRLNDLLDSTVEPIRLRLRARALCAGTGDAGTGAEFRETIDQPFNVFLLPQARDAALIRDLRVERDGADAALSWAPAPGATSYRVYRSLDPGGAPSGWTSLGEVSEPNFRDPAAMVGMQSWYWSVVALDDAGAEGPW